MEGISWTHGGHQLAQKFTTTTPCPGTGRGRAWRRPTPRGRAQAGADRRY